MVEIMLPRMRKVIPAMHARRLDKLRTQEEAEGEDMCVDQS